MTGPCKGCIYRTKSLSQYNMCNYMYMTNQPRGCPAGEGCIHKTTGQKPRNVCNLPEHKDNPNNRAALNKAYQLSHKAELAQYQRERRAKKTALRRQSESGAKENILTTL